MCSMFQVSGSQVCLLEMRNCRESEEKAQEVQEEEEENEENEKIRGRRECRRGGPGEREGRGKAGRSEVRGCQEDK